MIQLASIVLSHPPSESDQNSPCQQKYATTYGPINTYHGLDRLDAAGITFITLRRRSPSLLAEVSHLPTSAWRTITLDVPHRKYRKPRVFEQKACPRQRTYRQFFITDLGHDEPTILLTNDANSTARSLVTRYAKRMLIDNALADAV